MKILILFIIVLFSSCVQSSSFTTCPCLVTQIEVGKYTESSTIKEFYTIGVSQVGVSTRGFTFNSFEKYDIGDTLRIVKRK